jgi:hypothetical protein
VAPTTSPTPDQHQVEPPEPRICDRCGGAGTVEHFVTFVGMTDGTCPGDDYTYNCDGGVIRSDS